MSICSQCMRTLRRQARLEKQFSQKQLQKYATRTFITSIQRAQQAQPRTTSGRAPAIPTTTPTVTSNVTAPGDAPAAPAPPPSSDGSSTSPNISTSAMQKQIRGGLKPPSITQKLATTLRATAKSTTETYITYGLTEILFRSCAIQAPYTIPEDLRLGIYTGKGPPKNAREEDVGVPEIDAEKGLHGDKSWWFNELGLEPTFSVWSQVCFLHMYILTVKMRTMDSQKQFLDYQRYLMEHFSNAAEDKMGLLHGMNARGIRNKYLKELFMQWRGVLYAYDQGLVQGDAMLAGAVWRNLWKANEDVDWEKVAMVVGYMRRAISALETVNTQEIANGLKDGGEKFWMGAREGLERSVARQAERVRETII